MIALSSSSKDCKYKLPLLPRPLDLPLPWPPVPGSLVHSLSLSTGLFPQQSIVLAAVLLKKSSLVNLFHLRPLCLPFVTKLLRAVYTCCLCFLNSSLLSPVQSLLELF